MYAITYKNKPATLKTLDAIEGRTLPDGYTEDSYICKATKERVIEEYLFRYGFTWEERTKGVQCRKVGVLSTKVIIK